MLHRKSWKMAKVN